MQAHVTSGPARVTTIYVTHDQVEAMTMGDRVAVIKDGYLQQVDTPQNLYDRPTNAFVAAFIGSPSMNLYDATVIIGDDSGTIHLGSQQLTLPAQSLAARPALRDYHAKRVVIGVRPEDFTDAATSSATTPGTSGSGRTLTASVTLLEALGAEIMVHFAIDAASVDSGDPDAPETLPVEGKSNGVGRFSPKSQVRLGQVAEITVATESIHFFDADTREAIWQ